MMWFWGCKVKGQGHRVNKCIFTLMTIMPMLIHIWLTTAIRRGYELYECSLVIIIVIIILVQFFLYYSWIMTLENQRKRKRCHWLFGLNKGWSPVKVFSTDWQWEGHSVTKTLPISYPAWSYILSLHFSTFPSLLSPSPVWEGYGGMVLKRM